MPQEEEKETGVIRYGKETTRDQTKPKPKKKMAITNTGTRETHDDAYHCCDSPLKFRAQ